MPLRDAVAEAREHLGRSPAVVPIVEALDTVTAFEFCAGDIGPIEYLCPPMVVRGGSTIVYGDPKVGKTTLVAHLVHACLDPSRHPFLPGTQQITGPGLWLDLDQPRRVSRRRFKEAGADDGLHIYRGPAPSIARLCATLDALRADFLVVDNMTKWLGLEDEKNNSEFEAKFGPIQHELQNRDVTVVIIDHSTKADGSTGKTLRGGGHKLAAVDIAVEIKPEGPLIDGRRRLRFTSREELCPDMIVRLDGGRYVLEGTPTSIAESENELKVLQAIRAGHQRKDELARRLEVTTKTVESWIRPLIDRGQVRGIQSAGVGRPIVYHEVPSGTSGKFLGSSGSGEPF